MSQVCKILFGYDNQQRIFFSFAFHHTRGFADAATGGIYLHFLLLGLLSHQQLVHFQQSYVNVCKEICKSTCLIVSAQLGFSVSFPVPVMTLAIPSDSSIEGKAFRGWQFYEFSSCGSTFTQTELILFTIALMMLSKQMSFSSSVKNDSLLNLGQEHLQQLNHYPDLNF